jgi:hypothetical protein
MYFEKNAQALIQADAAHQLMLAQLQQCPLVSEADLTLFQTEDGQYSMQYRDVLLHDPTSPLQEAQKAFETCCKSGVDRVHLLLGIGLGYALDELYTRSPGQIIVYEPHLELLRFTLENVELSEIFASGRVRFATNHFDLLNLLLPRIYSDYELDILTLQGYATLLAAEIPVLVHKIKNLITDWARDYRTVKRFHPLWMERFFENYASFAHLDTIERLFNRFPDKPALVISRGPSLDSALEDIRAMQDAMVLVSVGSAVRRLWEGGITPDFAIFYDANGMQEQLEGIPTEALEKITFILCPSTQRCCYESPARGKMVFFSQNGKQMCDWMDQTLHKSHLRLDGGGTVSLIALQLAQVMGCSPIILAGQDLAFPNNQAYAGGIPLQVDEQGNLALTRTETLYAEPEAMTMVQGQNGEMLPALTAYTGFIRHFEALAAKEAAKPRPAELYNASIGGAHLEGYPLKALSEFRGCFPAWKIPFALDEAPSLSPALKAERQRFLKQSLYALKKDLQEMVSLCAELSRDLPAEDSNPDTLETLVWDRSQHFFKFTQEKKFISFLAMFEIVPYRHQFKAFAQADTFNPGIRGEFIVAMERCSALLNETYLPWIENAEQELTRLEADHPSGIAAFQQPSIVG